MLCGNSLQAKNLGVYGRIYDIQEQDALEWIAERLYQLHKSGEIEKQQHILTEKAYGMLLKPKSVAGLKKTIEPRIFIHDLTVVLPNDIVDSEGKVIYMKGTRINPLERMSSHKALIFFDADDTEQLEWALAEHKQRGDLAKLILVNGAIIDLMNKTGVRFYFDQSGRLVKHFHIDQIPAIVEQQGTHLLIREIKI